MPQHPKPIAQKVSVVVKKPSKTSKSAKPKKPALLKDLPFDLFAHSSVRIFALDRKGSVKFISDGKSLRVEALRE